MKKFFLLLSSLIIILVFNSFATDIKGDQTTYSVLHQSENKIVIEVNVHGFKLIEVQTPHGIEYKAIINDGTPMLISGAPDLQKLVTSVIIPDNKTMDVLYTIVDYTTHSNINIAPSKGNIIRPTDPASIPFTYSDFYTTNSFFPSATATLRTPHIVRDYRGQTIVINPIQYNPVTKELKVSTKIIVELNTISSPVINELVRTKPLTTIVDQFVMIYKNHFLNFEATQNQVRYTPLVEGGRMLIICYGAYMNAMQPFIDWKKQQGIDVEIKDVSTIGTTAVAIKSYIQTYYNTNSDFAYLLLVGDAAQVPSSLNGGQDSDQNYGYLAGGTTNHYPDIFVGRFSAASLTQVNTQVDRTVQYEKNPTPGTWYKNAIGIASDEGPGDDNQFDWEHERGIRTQLMGYNYTTVSELYDASHGGADAAGNPASSDVTTLVNNGVGLINYTGHGDVSLIVTTGFNTTAIDALTNTRKLPFVWIVGCQTGNFVPNTCFGESWARATDATGAPAGSIANFNSTINQSWNPPMEAQDEFNKVLTENAGTNIKRTFGGISVAGCMQMNDAYGTQGTAMTDTWVCFGDPSVMIRTDVPSVLTATHASQVGRWATSFTVNCNINNAMVGLYAEDKVLGTGYISGGNANITITNGDLTNITGDSMLVTVTAYNKIPYQQWVLISQNVSAPIIANENNPQIFPNPANDQLNFDFSGMKWENGFIRVYNSIGQIVNLVSINSNQQIIDISNLTSGVYNFQVFVNEKISNNKIVVK